jgi:hypothetical protein
VAIKDAALWGKGQLAKKQQRNEPEGQEEWVKQGKIQKIIPKHCFELSLMNCSQLYGDR